MSKLTMTRRTFAKMAAATAAAVGVAAPASSALAETKTGTTGAGEVKRIRSTCRGCGKMECGVWVTVENGRAVKIGGDESTPHTMGSCCNKSVSSLQACYHPDHPRYPMKRTNPKGEDPGQVRISWDEALDHAQTFTSMDPRTTNLGKESDIHLAVKGDTDATLTMCDVVIKNGP